MHKFLFVFLLFLVLAFDARSQNETNSDSALVNVLVTDYSEMARKGEQIIFQGQKTRNIYKGVSNAKGKFSVTLGSGETYNIKIKSIGAAEQYNTLEIPALEEGEYYMPLSLTLKFELPKTFTLDNVEFESGKATIKRASYKELNELLEYMTLKEDLKIEIAGHTDNVGDEASNFTLSKKRAENVKRYLQSKGIDADRIMAKGYGETQPIADNSTPEGRQKNRRTEVRILEAD